MLEAAELPSKFEYLTCINDSVVAGVVKTQHYGCKNCVRMKLYSLYVSLCSAGSEREVMECKQAEVFCAVSCVNFSVS